MLDNLQPAVITALLPTVEAPAPRSLGRWWHTVTILALFTLLAIAGAHRTAHAATPRHVVRYLDSILYGWIMLGLVVAGIYQPRAFFRTNLKHNARPWHIETARGFGIYLFTVALLAIVLKTLHSTRFAFPMDRTVIKSLAPQSWVELAVWFCVSLTAGFCEEHIFRGYLLPQAITALRRIHLPRTFSTVLAVITISVLFGTLHLYQGVGGAIVITLLGAIYACFALRFGNLRSLIVAHFLQDFVAGATLFARHLQGK